MVQFEAGFPENIYPDVYMLWHPVACHTVCETMLESRGLILFGTICLVSAAFFENL